MLLSVSCVISEYQYGIYRLNVYNIINIYLAVDLGRKATKQTNNRQVVSEIFFSKCGHFWGIRCH